ncbi:11615_t:CDS:2, partial [Funneliformis mosseae]
EGLYFFLMLESLELGMVCKYDSLFNQNRGFHQQDSIMLDELIFATMLSSPVVSSSSTFTTTVKTEPRSKDLLFKDDPKLVCAMIKHQKCIIPQISHKSNPIIGIIGYNRLKVICNKSWICNLSNDRKRMFSVTEEGHEHRVFLEIEDDENASKQRIASLINYCGENVTKDITKSELKTFPLKRSEIFVKDINIEDVEGTERIIEMNLGLGVFEQIKEPSECDIIMDPKGATSNNSTKPKIIMVDNGTSNIEAINELFIKRSKSPLIFKDDDEDQEFSNIIMNSHTFIRS